MAGFLLMFFFIFTSLGIVTFGIVTFGIVTFGIVTFGIVTFGTITIAINFIHFAWTKESEMKPRVITSGLLI